MSAVTDVADGDVLAVDLGGTHMRCAAVTPKGQVRDRHVALTPHDGTGPEALHQLMRTVAGEWACTNAVVGLPGRVDYVAGRLEMAPNLPQQWVPHLDGASLHAAVGLPVWMANDADVACVGETWFGAGRDAEDVAYLTLSTGVGAGVVLRRRLVRGRHSVAEIGHTIVDETARRLGLPPTLEDLASGTGLAREAARVGLRRPDGTPADAKEVVRQVRAGEAAALALWERFVGAAAAAVTNLAWLFAPQVIVVGGGLGLVGDLLLNPVRALLVAEGPPGITPPIRVELAALGDDAGLVGAAVWRDAVADE